MFYFKNNKRFNGLKHIKSKYLVVRNNSKEGQTLIERIVVMITDLLTKYLAPKLFSEHVVNGYLEFFMSIYKLW